jgi:hypothetical protein
MNYGYQEIMGVPQDMEPWGLRVELPLPSEYGTYALVDIAPADIETHH